jgi:NAD(P)-dependent dehydrogenase (short-subunit alcohol dehydrogenase family)
VPKPPVFTLTGKVALVTGAARGIGQATARRLIDRGASVVIVDLDQAAADAAAADLHPEKAIGIGADVTDRSAMQRAVATAVERFGGLDIVVANAGIVSTSATARAMAPENFERVLDVNVFGVWRTVEAAMPEVIRRRGHIVVVASVMAFVNGVGSAPYAMSKAAVEQLGRALRVELAHHRVGVTTAYFGFIDTPMVHKGLDEDPLRDVFLDMIPKPLHKRLPPSAAGEAIVDGIEHNRPRVVRPRRWAVLSTLRGILNPLGDQQMERDAKTQRVIRQVEEREGQEQHTTA